MKLTSTLLFLLFSALAFGQVQKGQASFYASKFEGRRTSNGEIYDGNLFTAAHRTLPFGTVIKVTNVKNQKWVMVRVNDRGPFVANRIVDLSYRAANHIDMVLDGVAHVELEVLPDSTVTNLFDGTMVEIIPVDSLPKSGYGIQIVSITYTETYMNDLRDIHFRHSTEPISLQSKQVGDRKVLRVILYQFETLAQAQNAIKLLQSTYPGCFVVDFAFIK